MLSSESLLAEVDSKLCDVRRALLSCEGERAQLSANLDAIKQAVEQSFKRHIDTLQCRAKWLVCHADSIYHLKEGSLNQQIAELDVVSSELRTYCERKASEDDVELQLRVKNILNSASLVATQPCESGTMSFTSNDSKLEDMIIGFGDIETPEHSMVEYDFSDEGIFVVENTMSQQQQQQHSSIEMKVKSIEMHHLTAESANSEKEEQIEMEFINNDNVCNVMVSQSEYSINDDVGNDDDEYKKTNEWLLRPAAAVVADHVTDDSGVGVETDASEKLSCSWLFRKVESTPEKSSTRSLVDFDVSPGAFRVKASPCPSTIEGPSFTPSSCEVNDKVPSWLIKCEEPNPWIRSFSAPTAIDLGLCNDLALCGSTSVSECDVGSEISFLYQRRKRGVSTNVDKLNQINASSSAKFLRSSIGSPLESISDSLNSLVLVEKSDIEKSDVVEKNENLNNSNESRADDVCADDNSKFLLNRCNTAGNQGSIADSGENKNEKNCGDNKKNSGDYLNAVVSEDNSKFLVNTPSNVQQLAPDSCESCDGCMKYCSNNSSNIDNQSCVTELEATLKNMDISQNKVKSNLLHLDSIRDANFKEFLIAADRVKKNLKIPSTFLTNSVLNHLRVISNKPDELFLRSKSKAKEFDVDMCEWLRGSSTLENCRQCFDVSGCEERLGTQWMKTAIDW